MTRYQVSNQTSGANLGVYEAASADEALDVMARDAGYDNFRESCLIAATGRETPEELDEIIEKDRAEMDVIEVA